MMSEEQSIKQLVKKKLLEFYMNHMDFDDRSPRHIEEAEALLKDLRQKYGWQALIEAVEELRGESERAAIKARARFYEAVLSEKKGGRS